MYAERISLGGGSYKRVAEECREAMISAEILGTDEAEEILQEENCETDCDLCRQFGNAFKARKVRENPTLRGIFAGINGVFSITDDDMCGWINGSQAIIDCDGCDDSPEYIIEEVEEMLEKLSDSSAVG